MSEFAANSIRTERQLRGELDRVGRRQRQAQEEDVVVELPRRLMLRSPNGTFWAVTVDDAGVLSTINMGTTLP